jgi:hypothetical protein
LSPSDLSTPFSRRFTDEGKRSLEELQALHESVNGEYRGSVWSHDDAIPRVSRATLDIIREDTELPAFQPLLNAFDTCIRRLLALESQIFSPIEADFSTPLTLREQMALGARLRERAFFLEHDGPICDLLVEGFREALTAVTNTLPAPRDSHLTIPLISAVRNPASIVEKMLSIYQRPEHAQAGIFSSISETLQSNLYKVSGVSPEAPSKKPLIYPTASNMRPQELVEAYLGGTPLRDLLLAPYPFALPAEQRQAGHWLIAPPGRGKTTCLHAMVADDLRTDAAIILMDSKGDLIKPFRKMRSIADRLIIIDPDPQRPIAINPLDIPRTEIGKAVELLEYLFASLLEFKLTATQSLLFRNVIRLLVTQFKNPTLDLFREILSDGWKPRYAGPVGRLEPRLKDFFYKDFYNDNYQSRCREVLQRLQLLLDNDTMNAMLSAPATRFMFDDALDSGKIIIINNSKDRLGDQGAEFFGRFFIAQLLATAQRRSGRPQHKKKPVYCYIDECQNVIARDEKISTILDECRSQKIGLILSHQRTAQITNDNVLSALRNCAIRFANSDAEARLLAASLRTSQQFLETLDRGQFAAYVRDTTKTAIALDVIKPDFSSEDRLTPAEQQQLSDKMMREYGRQSEVAKPQSAPSPERQESNNSEPRKQKKPKKPDDASEW